MKTVFHLSRLTFLLMVRQAAEGVGLPMRATWLTFGLVLAALPAGGLALASFATSSWGQQYRLQKSLS